MKNRTPLQVAIAALGVCLTAALPAANVPYDPSGPVDAGANTIVQWDFTGTEGDSPAPSPVIDSADPTLDGANNGTIAGGTSLQAGPTGFGTALSLAQARVTTTFDPSLINDSQQVTLAAWIKPDVNLANSYVLAGASGFLRFNAGGMLNAGFATTQDYVEVTGGNASSWYTGNWNHVAATFDHGTVSLYVNGVRVASNTTWANGGAMINASSANWTGNFNLGGAPWDPDDYSYSGLIDDVRLLNVVLPAAPDPVTDGTIVLWDLNETEGTTAADSAPLDGPNTGTEAGPFTWKAGKFGGGLSLNADYSRVTTSFDGTLVSANQQVTMSAWIKPSLSSSEAPVYVLGFAGGGGTSAFLRFRGSGWRSDGGKLNAGFTTSAGWVEATGGNTLSWYANTWNHVSATFSNGTVTLYVNGQLIASNTVPGATLSTPTSSQTFVMGTTPWEIGGGGFIGTMDDVRLSTVLPDTDSPPPPLPVTADTVVMWDLNETEGTTAGDSAPLDGPNNGTIAGGYSWVAGKFLSLGGGGYVTTPVTGALFTNQQQVTMSAWIKPSSAADFTYILGLAGPDDAYAFCRFVNNSLSVGYKMLRTVPGGTETNWVEVAGGEASGWYVGKWTHIASTLEQGVVSLYVNDELIGSNTNSPAAAGWRFSGPDTFVLGATPWALDYAGDRYNGLIDDVRLSTAPTPPTLGITVSNAVAYVYWPATSDPGFLLQTNSNLTTTNWGNAGPPFEADGYNVVTNAIDTRSLFYRLKK